MISNKNTPRFLGAAFLMVLITSALSNFLLTSVIGSGSTSDFLVAISKNLTVIRASTLIEMVTSVGIIVLAVLLYVVLHKQNKTIALVAMGWWFAEAITLAVSKIGAIALIPLSLEFVKAGAPESSFYQTLGEFFYNGIDRQGNDIHMLFYCLGGVLWFYLFYKSRYIPLFLSVWGFVAETIALIGIVLLLVDINVDILFFAHIALLELTIGLWLLVKGIRNGSDNL
jgi:hypothetical protein